MFKVKPLNRFSHSVFAIFMLAALGSFRYSNSSGICNYLLIFIKMVGKLNCLYFYLVELLY